MHDCAPHDSSADRLTIPPPSADCVVPIHRTVIEHLKKLPVADDTVFGCNGAKEDSVLYRQFWRIQKTGGIRLPCDRQHKHTDACHAYGFHDLRRAFATLNADRMTAEALQVLMKHKNHETTKLYINTSRQIDAAAKVLHVPDVLRKGQTVAERFAEQCRAAGFEVTMSDMGPRVEFFRMEDLIRLARCTDVELRLLPWGAGWVLRPEGD
jgi:hypothetical protein